MNIIGKPEAEKVRAGECPDCGDEIMQSFEGDGLYYCDCGFQVEANALVWAD